MAQGYGQSQRIKSGHGLDRRVRAYHALQRAKIFKLSPRQLFEYCRDALDLPEEGDDSELVEQDTSDLEDRDDDEPEPVLEEEVTSSSIEMFRNYAPVLDIKDVYALRVEKQRHSVAETLSCNFVVPFHLQWLAEGIHREAVTEIQGLMETVARWFTETRQLFLLSPSPETFSACESEEDFYDNPPPVTHKGFLSTMKKRAGDSLSITGDEPRFSNLLPHIWILWPKQCMPLSVIFAQQFKRKWLLQGCRYALARNGSFHREKMPSKTGAFSKQQFLKQSPEERFVFLWSSLGINNNEIREAILDELLSAAGRAFNSD